MSQNIVKSKFKGWHFLGNRQKLHIIIGKPKDDIGWITLCHQHGNGISNDELKPKDFPEKAICKTCMRLQK